MRIIYILISILLLASCSKSTQVRQNIFRYNESKGITTLDPAFARNQTIIWPVNQIFNGLVQLDEDLNVLPCIAQSWECSEDGKVYTFYLRRDILFHDHASFPGGKGRQVVASDFVYSMNRIIDPDLASPGAWIFNAVDRHAENSMNGFQAVSDTVFRIFLKEPFPAFPGLLTMPYCSVVPREAVEMLGDDFRREPVGTGPYRFRYWKEDEKLVLVKNECYFERDWQGNRLPYLDAVNISFTRDKQSEFMEFMMGRLDFLSGVHAVYKDEMIMRNGSLNPEYEDRVKMISQPYLNTEYLGFLLDPDMEAANGSPVLEKKIRQAINYGFDREKMMKYMRNNIGRPASSGFVPRGMPSFSQESVMGYTYDPDRARELLSQSGYPMGKGLPSITLTTTSDYQDLCEYIQHELYEIGIVLNIEVNTGAAFRDRMANGQLEFFRGSWIADYPDAENYLSLFYSRNFSPAGPNYTRFRDPFYDRLFEDALGVGEDELRYRLY
ncbi:MAG: ABC transporter substrate-binding protein, partial [Bacteroidales bacterium]|nr:ABC transporter substrate-binding protein [Bacteroidales bacterium]